MLGNEVQPVGVEVVDNLGRAPRDLSVVIVLNSNKGIDLIADLVSEEEVGLGDDLAANVVDEHVPKGQLVLGHDCPVVPGQVLLIVLEIDSQPVVGVALWADVVGSQAEAGVGEGFSEVEGGVEVPLAVPPFDNSVVEVQFDVVTGLDLGVEGPSFGEIEPVLNFVGKFEACLVSLDVGLEVDSALGALGVDFEGGEFIVDEVVVDEGVGLPGPLGPGVNFDAFRLGHKQISTK